MVKVPMPKIKAKALRPQIFCGLILIAGVAVAGMFFDMKEAVLVLSGGLPTVLLALIKLEEAKLESGDDE